MLLLLVVELARRSSSFLACCCVFVRACRLTNAIYLLAGFANLIQGLVFLGLLARLRQLAQSDGVSTDTRNKFFSSCLAITIT